MYPPHIYLILSKTLGKTLYYVVAVPAIAMPSFRVKGYIWIIHQFTYQRSGHNIERATH